MACIDEAYSWLCQARVDYSPHSDIWHLRLHWITERERLLEELQNENFQFSPVTRYHFDHQAMKIVFAARDALVLKMLALYLTQSLVPTLPDTIFHLKNNGGLKSAITQLQNELPNYTFIIKTDIKGFYGSIQFEPLMQIVSAKIAEKYLCDLIEQSLYRVDYDNGFYLDVTQSIPMGSPLSPILGALMLLPLAEYFGQKNNVYYAAYMDDFVICCKTKFQQRRLLKKLYALLKPMKLLLHPDKTFIGRISKGFDFLGYHFENKEITASEKTIKNFMAKRSVLFEQGADFDRIRDYCRRFKCWLLAGFDSDIQYQIMYASVGVLLEGE